MYYYKLQVLVLTADTALTDTVKKLEPLAGFEYEVLCRQNFDVAVKTADIVICDLLNEETLEALHRCKPGAAVVLSADAKFLEQLAPEDYNVLADIWVKPYLGTFIRFKLRRLFENIKNVRDCHLAENYLNTTINSTEPDLV